MRIEEARKRSIYFGILMGILLLVWGFAGSLIGSDSYAEESAGSPAFTGEGTISEPYLLESAGDLENLASQVSAGNSFEGKYLLLTGDIQLPEGWSGIGSLKEGETSTGDGKNIAPFSGILDGGGHTVTAADGGRPLFSYVRTAEIRNLKIAGERISGSGLIRNYTVDRGDSGTESVHTATIENVTILEGTSMTGSGLVSGYATADNTVDIIGCTAEAGVVAGCDGNQSWVGSFGGNYNGTITGCRSAATVKGVNYVGGIIGARGNSMSATSVSGCVFTGKVIASGSFAGGIAGGGYGGMRWGIQTAPNAPMLSITDCLSTGSVQAKDTAGGILGYETSLQVWENGQGSLQNNLFAGTVSVTEGDRAGGIAGAYRGLDKYNIIRNNYYAEGCGAVRGLGGAEYVDTSCETHETQIGTHYFDTSKEIPVFEGVNDSYGSNLRADHNRTDDPLGADADALAKAVGSEELASGAVTNLLNDGAGDGGAWIQGGDAPMLREIPMPTRLSVAEGYRAEYEIGEELDLSRLQFELFWSDGTVEQIAGEDPDLLITGFDSSKRAVLTLTAVYGHLRAQFPVKILRHEIDETMTVYFSLQGDRRHGPDADCGVHTRKAGNLTEWIPQKTYQVSINCTAEELIRLALADAGLKLFGSNAAQYGSLYLSGVQIPPELTDDPENAAYLSEKDNGPNSGWMYAVNDEEPGIGIGQYFLEDGDELILFYTDDYTKEKSAEPYQPEDPDQPEDPEPQVVKGKNYKVSGSTYRVTKAASASTSGTVTLTRAKNVKKVTVPAFVKLADGKKYKVNRIGKKAFAKSRAKTVIIKTKLLKNSAVKGSLKGSKVKTIKVKVGKKKVNRKYAKKYRRIFTKKNAGRKVKVK